MTNRNRSHSREKLTASTDETVADTLFSGESIFSIPYFQRPYTWTRSKLQHFETDLLSLVDEQAERHFLGAIILYGRSSAPSDVKHYEVIDGQQRITTLFIYIAAIVKILINQNEIDDAAAFFQKYLVINRTTKQISNIKLHPSREDRGQVNRIINDILSSEEFNECLPIKPRLLGSTGSDDGNLYRNYRAALSFLSIQFEQGGIERIKSIYNNLLEGMSVVQILINDPTNGPKIFDSLNSKQHPMSIGDLVRNEIFSRVSFDESLDYADQIEQDSWQPFHKKFQHGKKNLFDSYFFPYGLIQNPNLSKSEVYDALRKQWQHTKDPAVIISELKEYQNIFLDLEFGTNYEPHSLGLSKLFRNFHLLGAPSSTYPFLMQLSNAANKGLIDETTAKECLGAVESFLVRRAVCGHEPTGLHAVFKRLWADCKASPDRKSITKMIKKHATVVWPTNDDVRKNIKSRPMYKSHITKYLLYAYDLSLGGDQPNVSPWIEHILPGNPTKPWFKAFKKSDHKRIKDCLPNLLPLSQKMNQTLSNRPYNEKVKQYFTYSMYTSARNLAKQYSRWDMDAYSQRSREMGDWAITQWPY